MGLGPFPYNMTTKTEKIHLDLIGRRVNEGDAVAFTHHNMLYVGKVTKLHDKQLRVLPIGLKYRSTTGFLKYSEQCVLIGGPDLTLWILTKT